MKPLLDFAARVRQVAEPDDTLMVMCRSGGRSAIAVNFLAKAGFTNVHNIIDGMEGDANVEEGAALAVAGEAGLAEFGNKASFIALLGEIAKGSVLGRVLGQGAAVTSLAPVWSCSTVAIFAAWSR